MNVYFYVLICESQDNLDNSQPYTLPIKYLSKASSICNVYLLHQCGFDKVQLLKS